MVEIFKEHTSEPDSDPFLQFVRLEMVPRVGSFLRSDDRETGFPQNNLSDLSPKSSWPPQKTGGRLVPEFEPRPLHASEDDETRRPGSNSRDEGLRLSKVISLPRNDFRFGERNLRGFGETGDMSPRLPGRRGDRDEFWQRETSFSGETGD